jgi:hypothetical protein
MGPVKGSNMKPGNFLRYVILPAVALAAGVKLGMKYAQDHYVSKDRKFIEAEISKREKQKND